MKGNEERNQKKKKRKQALKNLLSAEEYQEKAPKQRKMTFFRMTRYTTESTIIIHPVKLTYSQTKRRVVGYLES
jgi:hypothetical protein